MLQYSSGRNYIQGPIAYSWFCEETLNYWGWESHLVLFCFTNLLKNLVMEYVLECLHQVAV